jgi:hypothetical protein
VQQLSSASRISVLLKIGRTAATADGMMDAVMLTRMKTDAPGQCKRLYGRTASKLPEMGEG